MYHGGGPEWLERLTGADLGVLVRTVRTQNVKEMGGLTRQRGLAPYSVRLEREKANSEKNTYFYIKSNI